MFNRPRNLGFFVALFAALIYPSGAVRALDVSAERSAADEAHLMREERGIDAHAVSDSDTRTEALAKQYGVEPSVVKDMHAKQPGWGGLTIKLSLAQNLMQSDPTKYPTMNEALAKVEALRAEGKGYGAIANELGFKLGPVVRDARHTRNQMRREGRQLRRAEHLENRASPENGARPEKPPRPEKSNHPEKMPKPEKPPKP